MLSAEAAIHVIEIGPEVIEIGAPMKVPKARRSMRCASLRS